MLDAVGIEQIIDLPGVGENFQGELRLSILLFPIDSAKCLMGSDSPYLIAHFCQLHFFSSLSAT